MALRLGTPETIRKNLADVSDAVYRLEGDCPDGERAWVMCRQLTEGEEGRVEMLKGAPETRWKEDGEAILVRPIDWQRVRREMIKFALINAGNILGDDDHDLFPRRVKGSWHGGDQAFYTAWDSLHPKVADAIWKVALIVNPGYDVNNIVHQDPFGWLRENYPDVHEEMFRALEETKAKNASRESTVS